MKELAITLAAGKSPDFKNVALDTTNHGAQLIGKYKDGGAHAQITVSNSNKAISYDECKREYVRVHRDWDPLVFERRTGVIGVTPSWMEMNFWQMGAHPLGLVLHGGMKASVSQLNHTKRLSHLFWAGEVRLAVHAVQLEELNVKTWVRFNPDKKSIRLFPQADMNVILLYHQNPGQRPRANDNKFWKPGDENVESPNYWQPFYSHGDAALCMPVSAKEQMHGRVLNQGSRDNEAIYFNEEDITFRLLGMKCEKIGEVTVVMGH